MVYEFQFKLKSSRKSSIRLMANSILLLNGFILIYLSLSFTAYKQQLMYGIFAIIAVVLDGIFKRKDWLFHSSGILLAFVGWMGIGYWWIGIVMIGLSAFAEIVSKDKLICFNENQILTTTLFGKEYNWKDLQNAIIKDGLLTMDFKNNKLLQVYLDQDISIKHEQEFNDFCQHCLKRVVN